MKNILSIDIEEFFYSEYIPHDMRAGMRRLNQNYRTSENIDKILELLNKFDVHATFFVVGEIAEKFPCVVEKILEQKHELAFHGHSHEPLWRSNSETLQLEIKKFNLVIKEKCCGFRAPHFSLNNETKWALKILENSGFIYDTSIFPAKTPLYGVWNAPIKPYKPSYCDITKESEDGNIWEFPLLVFQLANFRIPVSGGFYLRFLPMYMVEKAIEKVNRQGSPAVMYIHNWELDPSMPKLNLGLRASFVTYYKVEQTEKKLSHLLSRFQFTGFLDYINEYGLH